MRTAAWLLMLVLFADISLAQEKASPANLVVKAFVAPAYPRLARDARFQGTTVSELSIAPDGSVARVRIVSAHPLFTKYVEEALTKWQFMPVPSAQHLFVTVRFELEDCGGCSGQRPVAPEVHVSANLPDFVLVRTETECTCAVVSGKN